jgi:N-acetylglucosamine-6-phosphate deacetylase
LGPGRYTIGRWNLLIGEDLVARSPDNSHLVGSAMSMPQADRILRENLSLTEEEIYKLMYVNPKKAVGL